MGSIPFSSPKAGGNPIETWYAKGMDFRRNTIRRLGYHRIEFPTPPSVIYPISDMRRTGYTYPNRLDPRYRGSIYPTSHYSRGPRTNNRTLAEVILQGKNLWVIPSDPEFPRPTTSIGQRWVGLIVEVETGERAEKEGLAVKGPMQDSIST